MWPSPLKTLYLIAALALAGCAATTEPGWEGDQATPFDTAEALCREEAQAEQPGADRDQTFERCMARHGWTHSAR